MGESSGSSPPGSGPKTEQKQDSWKDLSRIGDIERPPSKISAGIPSKILSSQPPPGGTITRIRGLRLLVIDDDPARLDALAKDLRTLGAEVAVGDRTHSGFNQAAKVMPDAVISDLVLPGDQGFKFIQRLRRHPVLRWSPVLLLRWWEQTGPGEGRVLLARVLDRLEEQLAPMRVTEERIAAGRPLLGERIEMTGPALVLKLLSRSKIKGEFTLNDAWNIFTVQIDRGRLASASRRGIDGDLEEGEQTIAELLLCDMGKWSFRSTDDIDAIGDTAPQIEDVLDRANRSLCTIFGPDASLDDNLSERLRVRTNTMTAVAKTISATAARIAKAISDGLLGAGMDSVLAAEKEPATVERLLQSLLRCGAIRLEENPSEETGAGSMSGVNASVLYLFSAMVEGRLAQIKPDEPESEPEILLTRISQSPGESIATKGVYSVSGVAPEKVAAAKREAFRVPGSELDRRLRVEKDPGGGTSPLGVEIPSVTEELLPDHGALEHARPSGDGENIGQQAITAPPRGLIHDSYAPAPTAADSRDSKQMWLAIGLALLLGGLLAVGLFFIASGDRDVRAIKQQQDTGQP